VTTTPDGRRPQSAERSRPTARAENRSFVINVTARKRCRIYWSFDKSTSARPATQQTAGEH